MTVRPELLAEQSYVHFMVPIPHCPSLEAESGGCQSAHHFGGRMVRNGDLGEAGCFPIMIPQTRPFLASLGPHCLPPCGLGKAMPLREAQETASHRPPCF